MPKWQHSVLIILNFIFIHFAHAKEGTVFEVRRPVALDSNDKPPKDFFINVGSKDGLKVGMLVMVNRRQSLYDIYLNKSAEDLVVNVGQLRIIHVQPDLSVARLENIENREALPVLDYDAIMVGDKVDLSSAKMAPRKTASLDNSTTLETIPAPTNNTLDQ